MRGGVGALVKLAGKEFDGEGGFVFRDGEGFRNGIHLRFGEDQARGGVEFLVGKSIDVIALDDAGGLQAGQDERLVEVAQKVAGLGVVSGFFFDENTIHGNGERQSFGKRWMLGRRTVSASGMGNLVNCRRLQRSYWKRHCMIRMLSASTL